MPSPCSSAGIAGFAAGLWFISTKHFVANIRITINSERWMLAGHLRYGMNEKFVLPTAHTAKEAIRHASPDALNCHHSL
jgi:hypothetical protein